ncbi:unnamed protein product [Acanthoscelides obtectus]|uniref:Transposase n=1 Tax=Acanthoscelides obtectus TaxID=200917 RepID=A0A9P0P9W6_ACAOB|nr:unnamed protein product [Acanthoscelides obtectus]CAK1631737.1 hypothetical protein AOBTE_LOCUS7119 [Acanthoscelides obtectus]
MVWGSMSSKGVGKLHFVDENMDTNKYLSILEESLLPVMEECLTSGQDFVFQQDGAACHTSKKAIKWMEENNVPLLKWVSSSSDLSPIKTLWHEMKKKNRLRWAKEHRQWLKFPAFILVWGSMSSKGVGKLHFIDGNVDTNKYLAILDESLLPVMEECLTSGQDFVFQQDGAACHTSKKAIKWMEENNVPLLKWVSSSPDLSPIETLWHEMKKLLYVFGNEAPHQSTISHWYGEFKLTQENVDAVRKLIIENRHVPYREIEASLKISKISIQKNLHEGLGTEEQKAARVNWCQKMLGRFNSGNSRIYCYEPENKRQSAIWVIQGEEKPTKIIRSRSVSKKMVATFVSKAGHIATIPLNEQRTVTADWYTSICLPKVITELRKIIPVKRIILHQDNASSHTAQKTKHPDLSPNDFFTFPKIKNRLRGQRFQSPEEAVWNKCFENWFECMQMCINLRGEYFEKQ